MSADGTPIEGTAIALLYRQKPKGSLNPRERYRLKRPDASVVLYRSKPACRLRRMKLSLPEPRTNGKDDLDHLDTAGDELSDRVASCPRRDQGFLAWTDLPSAGYWPTTNFGPAAFIGDKE